jgi:peptidoglycan/xylan/chitin deacetylase (PgdA/CDA1 family)
MTVFHKLDKVGTLALDSFSLVRNGPDVDPGLFAQGMVSLTLDDAWLSQYQNAAPILNNAGLKATFGVISLETLEALPDNRISNPSLEAVDASTTLPVDWFYGAYGTNDATSTFPVAGYDGANAAKVQITNYTDGDAKWFFKDGTVIQNQLYTFSDYYISDATSTITVRYTYADNSVALVDFDYLSPKLTWTQYTKQFWVPANVVSMTVFHRITSVGSLTIDNAELKRVQLYMDPSMVQALQASGHEISSHTRTHASLSTVATSTMIDEIVNSRTEIQSMGISNVDTLIYPYGDYSDAVEEQVKNSGYIGARSVDRGYNIKSTDRYALKIQQVDASSTPAQIQTWVDQALADKTWLILMYHQLDNSDAPLGESPADFQATVNYLLSKSAFVVTMRQGLSLMNP